MPVEISVLVEVLCILCDEDKLKVTLKESLKGGAIAGVSTIIGGMLGGPIGLAVGKDMFFKPKRTVKQETFTSYLLLLFFSSRSLSLF